MATDSRIAFLLGGFLLNFLPFIAIRRVMYLYHYLFALVWLMLLAVMSLGALGCTASRGWNRRRAATTSRVVLGFPSPHVRAHRCVDASGTQSAPRSSDCAVETLTARARPILSPFDASRSTDQRVVVRSRDSAVLQPMHAVW